MLMFLKNPLKDGKVGKNKLLFFKMRKTMVFEILRFHFYLEELKATVNFCFYECKHIITKKCKN